MLCLNRPRIDYVLFPERRGEGVHVCILAGERLQPTCPSRAASPAATRRRPFQSTHRLLPQHPGGGEAQRHRRRHDVGEGGKVHLSGPGEDTTGIQRRMYITCDKDHPGGKFSEPVGAIPARASFAGPYRSQGRTII